MKCTSFNDISHAPSQSGPEGNDGSLLNSATDGTSVTPFQTPKPHPYSTDDEDRLDKLFDRTHQIQREEETMSGREAEDSLKSKMAALTEGVGMEEDGIGEESSGAEGKGRLL